MAKKEKKTSWIKHSTRVVGMDPVTFEEWWRFKVNRLQFLSVFLLLAMVLFAFNYVIFAYTPVGHLLPENIKNRNKQKIETAAIRLDSLEKKLTAQDNYISNLQKVILGEVSVDSIFYLNESSYDFYDEKIEIDTVTSQEEKELLEQIKLNAEKLKQNQTSISSQLFLFDPVVGQISRKFSLPDHPGVDIVTLKDAQIKACLDGVVMHASYNELDGFTVIISHQKDLISVYKHANTINVKVGDKIKTGQTIGIVGSTGERSTGPHLHFEIWNQAEPINPMNYFSFGN